MDTISLSRTVFETSKFLGFDLDLWPLRVIWVRKCFTIRKPICVFLFYFHGHHLLCRTVFEIFDFNIVRVYLDLHPPKFIWVNNFHTIQNTYMTSYFLHSNCSCNPGFLCSWSKTVEHYSNRHQKQFIVGNIQIQTKNISFPPSICIIVTCMLHAWDSISSSDCRHVIELKILLLLFDFYEHHLSISYRSRDNAGHNIILKA